MLLSLLLGNVYDDDNDDDDDDRFPKIQFPFFESLK